MKTILQTPTNRLETSLDFYSKLEFEVLPNENHTLVSDGKAIIEINPDRFARAGIKLFDVTWEKTVNELEKNTTVIKTDEGYLLSDHSGVWIYLMETQDKFEFDLSQVSASILGNFAGISLETIAIEQSLGVWQSLGFSKNSGSVEEGWICLMNSDGMTVSIMKPLVCPHLFFNPSLSYFNGENNPAIIEKVRNLNIPITEEITYFNKAGIVDNIIIRDPGGFGFFLFND
jgi:hypothetical protein